MGKYTKIEWVSTKLSNGNVIKGHTWNPWQGCHKVSPGCLNCYMYRDKKRFGQDPEIVVRSKPLTFNAPLKWKEPAKVFVCSWSDFFIEEADPWRDEAWEIMRRTPHLTYQLLTKRPENIKDRLPKDWPLKNVWLGVTAENQDAVNKRLPILLFDLTAEKKFISIEPMIGPVDIEYALCLSYSLDWVIVGGETGPKARHMNAEWALRVKTMCNETKTPFFMKQMTNKAEIPDCLKAREFPQETCRHDDSLNIKAIAKKQRECKHDNVEI